MTTNTNVTALNVAMNTTTTTVENIMQDLTLEFADFNAGGELPEAITTALTLTREAALDKGKKVKAQRADTAMTIILAKHMLDKVGGKDTWIGDIIFTSTIEQTYWWGNITKDDNKTTHGKRFQDALIATVGEDSPTISLFKQAVKYFRTHTVEKLEGGIVNLMEVQKDTKTKQVTKVLVKEIDKGPLSVTVTSNGLRVGVKYNTVITPVRGQPFVFNRNTVKTFGMNVINENLEKVINSLRIHNERLVHVDEFKEKQVLEYTEASYKFKKEDALVLLLLLQENNIDTKKLFEDAKNETKSLLVLSRKEGLKGVKSLQRVAVPAHTFKKKYGLSGVTSTNDAKQGYVVPMVSIPRLVEFQSKDIVLTRENVNKTASRFDKLNNATPLWTRTIKLFVIADATKHPMINQATVGGNMLVPNAILLSDGACRVVTDMDNGGVKSSYTPFRGLDNTLALGDTCVISSAGFKGGMLAALGLAVGDVNIIKGLFNIVDINSVKDPDGVLTDEFKSADIKRTDALIERMQQSVVNRMTTMIIAGEEVSGVLVTVDVKITNTYTIDQMRAVEEEEVKDGNTALSNSRKHIEEMLEEMETDSKSSNGLRAFVAEQKAANADSFSVSEWRNNGLVTGKLKRKELTTKVIAQELQTIALTEGKDVAMKFLSELLEEQKAEGYSVNKLYAYQLLGAIEKDTIRSVDVKDLVLLLQESSKGIVEGSPVYSKELIQDVIGLIGTEDYGWVTLQYPNGTVDLPLGRVLLGDTLEQIANDKGFVVLKGLLSDLLENCKTLVNSKGVFFSDSQNHLLMEAFVQKPLLGKNFGNQFTKGYYGVALPMLGNYGISTAGITNRNRMVKSSKTWEKLTLSKAPQYFKGMTACYNVVDLDFGAALNGVLECAVFVNVEIVLMHQNDFDGDMYRISIGSSLPFVTQIYNEFNGSFFKSFYEGELESNVLKMRKSQQCSLSEYHEAIFNAVTAKDHIGSYTANSYYYEAMLPNLVGSTFVNKQGVEIEVTADKAYQLTAILKMLIQVEAMDNVKQEGSNTFITESLFHYKLRNLKGYAGKSDNEVVINHLTDAKKALMLLVNSKDINLDTKEVSELVDIAYHTAISFDTKATTVFNVYNQRNIEVKNFDNILNYISEVKTDSTVELNTMYNFNNKFEDMVNGIDFESMYYEILISTAQALDESSDNIRI